MESDQSWFALAVRPDIVTRAIKVGLVVGTILAMINHGNKILTGSVDLDSALRIALTYLVPYGVSTWSSVQTVRKQRGEA